MTFQEQINFMVKLREVRTLHFPKWIASKKVSAEDAEYETECMDSIIATLEKLKMLVEVSDEMKAKAN